MIPTAPLIGMHHVGLHSPDPDRLIAFYRDMFGLEPHPMPAGNIRGQAYFHVGASILLEIIAAEQPGRDHLAFAVAHREDLVDLRARLLAAGHEASEIRELTLGCCLDFHDTDGRRGEIVWATASPAQRETRP